MRILPDPISFDWDQGNLKKNYKKHQDSDKETEQVFENKQIYIFEDEKHSFKERRFMIWGITDNERKLTVFFTMRRQRIRIISARDMNKKERRTYEEKIQNNT